MARAQLLGQLGAGDKGAVQALGHVLWDPDAGQRLRRERHRIIHLQADGACGHCTIREGEGAPDAQQASGAMTLALRALVNFSFLPSQQGLENQH